MTLTDDNPAKVQMPVSGCGPLPVVRDLTAVPLRQRLFESVRAAGSIARVDIARALSVSPATVTQLSADLIGEGLIEETELGRREGDPARGRPPVGLRVRPGSGVVIGIKISDRANSALVLDMAGNRLGSATIHPPSGLRSTEEILVEIEALVKDALAEAGVARENLMAVAAGIPGMVDFEAGYVIWCPCMAESHVALRDLLVERIGCPVRIDNDANLLALAELWFGAGRGLDNFAVVSIEHGVGMGLVNDHRLQRGGLGHGMEIGHTKIQLDGALCRCGQRGCLEAYVADYALVREAHTALSLSTGGESQGDMMEALFAQAKDGNDAAKAIFARAGRYLAAGLANVVTLFDPTLIFLSGERMRYDYLYAEEVLAEMREMTRRPGRPATPVEIHAWGDLIWAQGAGALALDHATEMRLG
ncbi:ROK family transcriptional regulator [Celeribacter arenosi]|uniref:ROK family protein n=1 Tax=Celeribacter arenosi TaxID=792649 RepID=A0ABP7KG07_9RHOB